MLLTLAIVQSERYIRAMFDQSIADKICERLESGETLSEICRSNGMPKRTTVHDWTVENSHFAEQVARARDAGHDVIAARARHVARGTDPDASGDVQRDKLIVDTDLRLLAKWDNKRYGDRLQTDNETRVTVVLRDLRKEET